MSTVSDGTAIAPNWTAQEEEVRNGTSLHSKTYTFRLDDGQLEIGAVTSVMFTVDRPAKDVWPHLSDFNGWQNEYGHYYSGVIGELEGKTFRLSAEPDDGGPHQYHVLRVIPEHVFVVDQPGDWEGGVAAWDGFHTVMLNEHDGKSTVTIVMQHSLHTDDESKLGFWTSEEAGGGVTEWHRKWGDVFVPTLRKLIDQGA
jgi:hypothetical protein